MVWAWCTWCICEDWTPVSVSDIIVYLAVASVAAELSEETTGASAVLTSAVWCTVAWDKCSSETAVAVSASITVAIVAVLSACTAGAAVVPGATASAALKSDHDRSNQTTWLGEHQDNEADWNIKGHYTNMKNSQINNKIKRFWSWMKKLLLITGGYVVHNTWCGSEEKLKINRKLLPILLCFDHSWNRQKEIAVIVLVFISKHAADKTTVQR